MEIIDYLLRHLRVAPSEWNQFKLSYRVSPHPEAFETDLQESELPLAVMAKRIKAHENIYGRLQAQHLATYPRLYLVNRGDFKNSR